MKRFTMFAALMLGILASAARADQTEEAAVREIIGQYLHGLKFNDVASLRGAFHPEARLFFAKKDGSLGQLTQEQWYKGFEKNAGQEEAGTLSIVSVDISGTTASVKVREEYPTSTYTDYVSLLRLSAGWRIVNKAVAREVLAGVGPEIRVDEALMIAVNGAHLPGPAVEQHEIAARLCLPRACRSRRRSRAGPRRTGRVAVPGFGVVAPGSGVMRIPPVSVCHHVSTTGHLSVADYAVIPPQASGLIGSPTRAEQPQRFARARFTAPSPSRIAR